MKFRNMTFYRFPEAACTAALAGLETSLAEHPFREPGPCELGSSGFVSPLTYDAASPFVVKDGDVSIIALATERKAIPASAIRRAVKKKIDEITALEQRRVNGRERKRIKGEVVNELMMRALTRRDVTLGFIDVARGWVVVGTTARGAVEEFISRVREALGRFPATPLAPEKSPRAMMTDWVIRGALPVSWLFGDECLLLDTASGSRWSGRRIDIESAEVKDHLRAGMQVCSLGVELSDQCTFVLDELLCVRKFALTEGVLDAFDEANEGFGSAQDEARATLIMESREILRLLAHIDNTFDTPMPKAAD